MRDIEERFRSLARTPAPDLWNEIDEREPRHAPGPAAGRRIAAAAVALFVAVAGVGLAAWAFRTDEQKSRPTATVTNGLLAFASGGDVWVVHPDGSGLANVTNTRRPDDAPDGCTYEVPREWSPDGSRLALYGSCDPPGSEGGANYDVFVMEADGRGRENLTTSPEDVESGASQLNPHWSPDGTQIAFDGDDGLYVVGADGSGLHKVADGGLSSWAPDGERIAFVGDGGIHTADADGSNATLLLGEPGFEDLPAWSPTGDLIAFIAPLEGGGHQLEAVRPDGGGRRRLTDLPNDGMGGYSPSWSPDGSRIAIEVHQRGSWDLYVVNADGSGVTQLTNGSGDENRPTWSPDGTKIAFMGSPTSESTNSGTFDVYTVDPDGTNLTQITDGPGAAPGALTWQPVLAEETTPSPSPTTDPVEGSISAIDGFLPEGRLLLQVDDRVELLEEGAETSRLIGEDLFALDLSPDGSRALVSTPWDSGGPETALVSLDLNSGERTLIADMDSWGLPARWSPDGSSVAVRVGERNLLCLRDLASDEPRCLPELGRVFEFDWSPDSTQIVFEQGLPGSLTILDVGTGQTTVLVRWDDPSVLEAVGAAGLGEPTAIQFQGPRWSPSGRFVAALGMVRTDEGHANMVLVLDLNGSVVARGVPFGEFSEARRWSPTADVFAYASGEPPYRIVEARLLDVSAGEDRLVFPIAGAGGQTIHGLVWSPSGRWIAVVLGDVSDGWFVSEIQILDTTGADPPRIFETSAAFPELIDWAP